jgi:hypothetical protein
LLASLTCLMGDSTGSKHSYKLWRFPRFNA